MQSIDTLMAIKMAFSVVIFHLGFTTIQHIVDINQAYIETDVWNIWAYETMEIFRVDIIVLWLLFQCRLVCIFHFHSRFSFSSSSLSWLLHIVFDHLSFCSAIQFDWEYQMSFYLKFYGNVQVAVESIFCRIKHIFIK